MKRFSGQTSGLPDSPLPQDSQGTTAKEAVEKSNDESAESSVQAADSLAKPMQTKPMQVSPKESLQVAYSGKPEPMGTIDPLGTHPPPHFISCKSCKALIDYQALLQKIKSRETGFEHMLWIALLVTWAVFLIWFLTTTAQHFFVPPLIYWAHILRLRPEVAGATLLAMGNGAPDIFAVTVAAKKDELPLALSELVGANVFVLCITGGAVILASKYFWPSEGAVHFHGDRILESVLAYCFVLVVLAIVLLDGSVSTLEACVLPATYLLYVTMLVWRGQSGDDEELHWLPDSVTEMDDSSCNAQHGQPKLRKIPSFESQQLPMSFDDAPPARSAEPAVENAVSEAEEKHPVLATTQNESPAHHPLVGMQVPKGSGLLTTLGFILVWPTYFVRWVTIPPSDGHWDHTRRMVCALSPTGLVLFLSLTGCTFQVMLQPAAIWAQIVASVLFGLVIYMFSDDGPRLPGFYPLVALTAKVSSVIWLYVAAAELTAVVESLGRAFEIPPMTLGFTSIAWGNACGDLLSCLAMVQRNQSRAAFAAVLAGPLFDNLIGFGIVLLLGCHARGGEIVLWESVLHKSVKDPMLAGLASVACAICIMFCMIFFDRQMSSHYWGFALFASYFVFLGTVLFST